MTAFEIILDNEEMDRGESRFFPEGRFQIHLSSRGFYHFSGFDGEFHRSAQARSLYRYINKAINSKKCN
jgi:hypothetical protein